MVYFRDVQSVMITNLPCTAGMLLGSCLFATVAGADYPERDEVIQQPLPARFSVCFDHSCTTVVTASLNDAEWRRATAPFNGSLTSAEQERAVIARSIAIFEEIIGGHFGTSADRGRNLAGMFRQGQLDCIDEATNTTTYLRMLEQAGLLGFHRVEDTSTRFGLFAGMPHTTAVIRATASGRRFAVDSWFFDNGQPPYIVMLRDWKAGRDPD